jgi:hypothetical protein
MPHTRNRIQPLCLPSTFSSPVVQWSARLGAERRCARRVAERFTMSNTRSTIAAAMGQTTMPGAILFIA